MYGFVAWRCKHMETGKCVRLGVLIWRLQQVRTVLTQDPIQDSAKQFAGHPRLALVDTVYRLGKLLPHRFMSQAAARAACQGLHDAIVRHRIIGQQHHQRRRTLSAQCQQQGAIRIGTQVQAAHQDARFKPDDSGDNVFARRRLRHKQNAFLMPLQALAHSAPCTVAISDCHGDGLHEWALPSHGAGNVCDT